MRRKHTHAQKMVGQQTIHRRIHARSVYLMHCTMFHFSNFATKNVRYEVTMTFWSLTCCICINAVRKKTIKVLLDITYLG